MNNNIFSLSTIAIIRLIGIAIILTKDKYNSE